MSSSKKSRSSRLLGLAAKIGGKEVSRAIEDKVRATLGSSSVAARARQEAKKWQSRIDQARLITEELSHLKGAAMKAGQLLSLDAGDYFPPEAIEFLAKLQNKSEPVAVAILEKVVRDDLGVERLADLAPLSEVPLAAASIGQVHRARLNGQDVALKIQYPGVSDSVDNDLRLLKSIAQTFVKVTGRRIGLDAFFVELRRVLILETDYRHELASLQRYRQLLEGDRRFRVPVPYPLYCSHRVLTMSLEEGRSIQEWLAIHPSQERKNELGRRALDLYCREFFEWGLVQTDPNFGNFLVGEGDVLILLDFGATLTYSDEFRAGYTEILRAIGGGDKSTILREALRFGLIDDREDEEARELFVELMRLSVEPFQGHRQPFHFGDTEYAARTREAGRRFAHALRYSPPPEGILFLHRKLGGLFTLLKKLNASVDLAPYWSRMVEEKGH